jgi:hypothetical protein
MNVWAHFFKVFYERAARRGVAVSILPTDDKFFQDQDSLADLLSYREEKREENNTLNRPLTKRKEL